MIKERVLQFLNNEGLSPSQFAEILGIQRSSISHILSGRNKPSYDFFSKLVDKYPNINLEWFFNASNSPYKDEAHIKVTPHPKQTIIETEKKSDEKGNNQFNEFTNVNTVKKVLVMFTDGTFELYTPKGKESNDAL